MKIQSGDTLSSIARRNNTTVARLMELNPQIKDANKIYAGRELKLPGDGFETTKPKPALQPDARQPSTFEPAPVQTQKPDATLQQQVARMPPALRELYDQALQDDPALAQALLQRSAADPRVAQAAEGATFESVVGMMGPGARDIMNQLVREDPKQARAMMISEFLNQVDVRTAPKLAPGYESALVANMPPGLRETYNQLLKDNPNDARRVLNVLAQNPAVLRSGRDVDLAAVERNLPPAARAQYQQLCKVAPDAARRMLMQVGLEQFFR